MYKFSIGDSYEEVGVDEAHFVCVHRQYVS